MRIFMGFKFKKILFLILSLNIFFILWDLFQKILNQIFN